MSDPARDPLTVGQAFDVMLDSSDSVRRSADYLKVVVRALGRIGIPIVATIGLIAVAQMYQIELRDDKIQRLEQTQIELKALLSEANQAANEAKEASNKAAIASESADASLKGAIANSQRQTQDSSNAINRINEIYDTCVVKKEC